MLHLVRQTNQENLTVGTGHVVDGGVQNGHLRGIPTQAVVPGDVVLCSSADGASHLLLSSSRDTPPNVSEVTVKICGVNETCGDYRHRRMKRRKDTGCADEVIDKRSSRRKKRSGKKSHRERVTVRDADTLARRIPQQPELIEELKVRLRVPTRATHRKRTSSSFMHRRFPRCDAGPLPTGGSDSRLTQLVE
jgi:hypothetical protein